MLKTLLFLATLGLFHQAQGVLTPDCERFENGCPVDISINLLLPHETSCRYFYQCVAGEKILQRCGTNTWFNEEEQACDHPENVDRTCEDESVERPPKESSEEREIVFLPNGCPADFEINWLLPHDRYCNLYYHCVFGDTVIRFCQDGLHFNATSQRCDFPNNVNCTLPGGNYFTTTSPRPPTPAPTPIPPPEFNENGCPRNHSIEWLLPHENCTLYYQCVWGNVVERPCPAGLHFNPIRQICDNPATAGCANFHPCEDEDDPCSGEGSGGGDPPSEECPPGGGGGPGCEDDTPPVDECPPGGGGGPGCEDDTPPVDECPPGGGGGPGCEDDTPPVDECPPGGGGGPGCEDDTPPVDECPPGGGGGPGCSSEEDLPPGGDCPPGGGGGPGCEDDTPPVDCPPGGGGGPGCSSEEDLPPGGDCPPGGGGGPGCEDPPPDDDCDDDPLPGPPGNKCEEECITFPWAHEDCDKFWYCYGNTPVLGTCSNGLYFNPATRTCDFACYVDCDSGKVRVTPKHEGLNLYIPWHKFDDSARQLLKAIGQ